MRKDSPVDTPFRVSSGLEHRRLEFRKAVTAAWAIVNEFAAKYSWEQQARVRTFDAVEIFSTQGELWKRVIELDKLPADSKIPTGGFVAVIESRVLVAVTPEEYGRINPEYAATDKDAWTRLLAHEMTHRLHVEILGGDEDAMGPTWFFEGFAMAGAGQNLGSGIRYESADDALSAVTSMGGHARGSCMTYAAAMRFFMQRLPLKDLVNRAGRQGFEEWLRSSIERL